LKEIDNKVDFHKTLTDLIILSEISKNWSKL